MKRFYALLCTAALLLCLCPVQALASGQGNLDGGGGSMNQGTSTNFWSPGNDGVRVTVVDAQSGAAVSTPVDFANRSQSAEMLHFGKVNKIQYRDGASLSLQSGVPYNCRQPAYSMPAIITSNSRPATIEAIKRYFCSEYACMMVADAAGVSYERMLSGEYKILLEPIAYVTFNGAKYAFTATEAALYDLLSGGSLRSKLPSVAFQNLPLALFLEYSDLGFPAWGGGRRGIQSNADIINALGVGIVWFEETEEPGGEIEAPDVEYRVDTDVITAIRLQTNGRLTPDNPAAVTFHIMGRSYTVRNIVIPAHDSQLVWVKWHTPPAPQTITITVTLSSGFTAQDTFVAKIVDLNEKIPPDPLATDVNPGYSVPALPVNPQKLSAGWGVWSCHWVPNWQWHSRGCSSSCSDDCSGGHGEWVDEGDWEYDYTSYSASISGTMALMPDDIVPTANGKDMKSGYGVKTEVRATLSTNSPDGHHSNPQTAFSVFPEFQYNTYLRLLQRVSSGRNAKFTFQPNEFSTYGRTVHFTPVWFPDSTSYVVYTQVWDAWTPDGMLSVNLNDYITIHQSVFDDWYTNRE